jgi:branched-chain amino acid transport system ATP-binding protein
MPNDRDGAPIALQVSNLVLGYGDLTAVWDASLSAARGQVTALLGRNGAGKTTLLSGIAGVLKARGGEVRIAGRDITRSRPWTRTRAGIGLVPEGRRIFRELTVRQNLVVAQPPRSARANAELLDELLVDFPVLAGMLDRTSALLSGGQQQQLAIAQAVAGRPSVLLLDEPSSGLSPQAYESILEVVMTLCRQRNLAVVLVEQYVENAFSPGVDRIVVMERGRVLMDDDAAAVDRRAVEQLYISG